MRYRQLGNSGLSVSEIGFGTWGLGGTHNGAIAYGPTNDEQSLVALETALRNGINFYDTSDFYGHGHSESLLGEAFATKRDQVIIASKAGLLGDGQQHDISISHISKSLEGSLKRLRTNYLDLLQLHNPPAGEIQALEAALEYLARLKTEKTITAIGVSLSSPTEALHLVGQYEIDAIQVNFNLIDQRARELELFELCEKYQCGIIARTPLCFGFLSGDYPADSNFDKNDHRSNWSQEQRQVWANSSNLFHEMIQTIPNQTAAQFALRYCLSPPQISTTIPGMLTANQVNENTHTVELPFMDQKDLYKIESIYSDNNFYVR